ncbi:MAG: nitroreductase family deazaflavin-dependent oxidoreductase [Pseudomonadota bacterium]
MELLKTPLVRRALDSSAMVSVLKHTVPALDLRLMRLSRGWVNTGMQTVALIETTGAKSGAKREIVTLCMPAGDDLILVGSNWGQERDPAWVHNLRAHPVARVRYRGFDGLMEAREMSGKAREDMWQRLVRYNPQYGHYQSQTNRRLPVVSLTRTS